MNSRITILIISFLYFVSQTSCKKEQLLTDSSTQLSFSTDSILFDTVFVTIGSVTKNFKIYNTYDRPLKISNIHLGGGANSNFRVNIDGSAGTNFTDVEIRGGDSAWVFIEVTVDPNSQTLPYVIQDSLTFETNGNLQKVILAAWGQNAHFIVADRKLTTANSVIRYALLDTNLNANIIWDNTLPYVVYGGYAVVDSSQTLTINAGSQIRFNNSAGLWVYKGGSLKVKGTKQDPVVFQGLRREFFYVDEPGQWDRIWINDGGTNEINYAIIKNAFIGLQTETISDPALLTSLKITNTIVKNMSGFGMLARTFNITGWNSIFANCGQYCAAFSIGGMYDFTNCTFANYWTNGQRSTPAFYLNNYATINGVDQHAPMNAKFKNCIIYGSNDNELEVDMIKSSPDSIYSFSNLLVKANNKHETGNPNYVQVIRNADPNFKEHAKNDYHLELGSAALNVGDAAFVVAIPLDLDASPRIVGSQPDLGAYEKQ